MQIVVEACTKEPRMWQGKTQWGVKLPGDGGWVTLYREAKPTKGEKIEVNITERNGKNGTKYRDAFPVMPALAPEPVQTDKETRSEGDKETPKITWDTTREFVKAAHNLALVLEPDEVVPSSELDAIVKVDRSTARAAITNTLVIAYTSGKIFVPAEDEPVVDEEGNVLPW